MSSFCAYLTESLSSDQPADDSIDIPHLLTLPVEARLASLSESPSVSIDIHRFSNVATSFPKMVIDAFAPHLLDDGKIDDFMKDGDEAERIILESELNKDSVSATPEDAATALDWMISAVRDPTVFEDRFQNNRRGIKYLISLHRGFLILGINQLADELKEDLFNRMTFRALESLAVLDLWHSELEAGRSNSIYLRLMAWNIRHHTLENVSTARWRRDLREALDKSSNKALKTFILRPDPGIHRLTGAYRTADARTKHENSGKYQIIEWPNPETIATIFTNGKRGARALDRLIQRRKEDEEIREKLGEGQQSIAPENIRQPDESFPDFFVRIGWPLINPPFDPVIAMGEDEPLQEQTWEELNACLKARAQLHGEFKRWFYTWPRCRGPEPGEWFMGQWDRVQEMEEEVREWCFEFPVLREHLEGMLLD